MRSPLPSCVILAPDADESLRSLLSDVLGDMGIALRASAMGPRPDVVLALVRGADSVAGVLRAAGNEAGAAPVVVLLPFDDERLRSSALKLGARGCYALGTPLEELKELLRDVVSPRAAAPGLGAFSGRHDDGA